MSEFDRLNDGIAWIDLSFVERDRTPLCAIEVGIRCHLAGMSLCEVSKFLEEYGIDRSHVAIHNWVHKADRQPISTVSVDQLAVDETMIRLHGQQFWLYGAGPSVYERNFSRKPLSDRNETDSALVSDRATPALPAR